MSPLAERRGHRRPTGSHSYPIEVCPAACHDRDASGDRPGAGALFVARMRLQDLDRAALPLFPMPPRRICATGGSIARG